ncbi:hypothetical protein ERX46_07885 [Brumimicrobium glaciale]|uniref:DUF3575 domain-containing protein n=1 Tax=Brumimicrobium glaciale TaxID=200475 RepID=A0A4Q4KN81_9FLAO|nr:hypothetical protein [Brumimicrobium glaciale]RYM33874.1 hypothetical protein ERX46_07885 [Brumimicrobium glaciale]
MKKIQITFLAIILCFTSFSQNNLQGFAEVSQSIHTDNFTETNLKAGITFPKADESFSILIHYSYNGNSKMTNTGQYIPAYTMTSHFLGFGLKHRMFNENTFYSPSISLSFQTEIASDYRGEFVNEDYHPRPKYFTKRVHEYGKNYTVYSGIYYISSPLIGRLAIENEFKVSKSLSINLGLGAYFRAFKAQKTSWSIDDEELFLGDPFDRQPEIEISKPINFKNVKNVVSFDLTLGLIYKFSISKNTSVEK